MRAGLFRSLSGAAALLALVGCRFGDASFDGKLGERGFDPAGTVFSYIDARDDDLVERDTKPAAVAMVWIAFDPEGDLNDLAGADLESYRHELRMRDALSLVFRDVDELSAGALFESLVEGGTELGEGAVKARLHLAPERITRASTYASFEPYGARRSVKVTLREVRLLEGSPRLSGDVVVEISRAATDSPSVLVGRLEGRFSAPLVDERAAEQNLSLLGVHDLLGLPLIGSGS
jgi:hypothetical protein